MRLPGRCFHSLARACPILGRRKSAPCLALACVLLVVASLAFLHSLSFLDGWTHSLDNPLASRALTKYLHFSIPPFVYAPPLNPLGIDHTSVVTLVSIVLPTYNGFPLLETAVDSILFDQEPLDPATLHALSYATLDEIPRDVTWELELIVVNDGSRDGDATVVYLESLQSMLTSKPSAWKTSLTVLHHTTNKGLPAALNTGFKEARGIFHSWISSDNRQLPSFVKTLVAGLVAHPEVDMAYADFLNVDQDGNIVSRQVVGTATVEYTQLLSRNIGIVAFMYRKRCLSLMGGEYETDLVGAEDWSFWIRIRHYCGPWLYVPIPLVEYRRHSKSMTATMNLTQPKLLTQQLAIERLRSDTAPTISQALLAPAPGSSAHLKRHRLTNPPAIPFALQSLASYFPLNQTEAEVALDFLAARDLLYFANHSNRRLIRLAKAHLARCSETADAWARMLSAPGRALAVHSSIVQLGSLCSLNRIALLAAESGASIAKRELVSFVAHTKDMFGSLPTERQATQLDIYLETKAIKPNSDPPKFYSSGATAPVVSRIAAALREIYTCKRLCGVAGSPLDLFASRLIATESPENAKLIHPSRIAFQVPKLAVTSLAIVAPSLAVTTQFESLVGLISVNPFGMFRRVYQFGGGSPTGSSVVQGGPSFLITVPAFPSTLFSSSTLDDSEISVVNILALLPHDDSSGHEHWWKSLAARKKRSTAIVVSLFSGANGHASDSDWLQRLRQSDHPLHATTKEWLAILRENADLIVVESTAVGLALAELGGVPLFKIYHSTPLRARSERLANRESHEAAVGDFLSLPLQQCIIYRAAVENLSRFDD